MVDPGWETSRTGCAQWPKKKKKKDFKHRFLTLEHLSLEDGPENALNTSFELQFPSWSEEGCAECHHL